jgi:pyruvate dehydrogenase E2 component (dihydrolipoamide acetyltransferase)
MEFKLPEIGEGVQEGELIKWLVKEGDTVNADQPILEVMTDKATVEVPAPQGGTISGINAKEGQMIKVGQVLAQIQGGAPTAKVAVQAPAVAPVQAPTPTPAIQKTNQATYTNGNGAYRAPSENLNSSSVPAAPIVRAMASKAGVDLSQVRGTGPAVGGMARVLEEDLLRFLDSQSNTEPASSTSFSKSFAGSVSNQELTERKPLRGLRRVIAQAMVKSKYTAPHYSYVDEFECSGLVALREEAKKIGEKLGAKITYLPFIVKAVVGALKEFPIVNSSLEETPQGLELVYKKFFHIGFAVATPDGLLVPVIKNADKKSLLEISKEINELSEKVRAGKAAPEDLKGSTFSITSMGNVGGLFATPIINYPEVGILGVYRVQEKPIVKNSQIVIGKTMHLSLSLDHRVVDGAVGGYFCNAIIARLQEPARLLMELV